MDKGVSVQDKRSKKLAVPSFRRKDRWWYGQQMWQKERRVGKHSVLEVKGRKWFGVGGGAGSTGSDADSGSSKTEMELTVRIPKGDASVTLQEQFRGIVEMQADWRGLQEGERRQ